MMIVQYIFQFNILFPLSVYSFRLTVKWLSRPDILVDISSKIIYFFKMILIKNEIQKQNLCKFLYDIAKIVFGTVVISQVFKPPEFRIWIFISGLITTVVFFLFAYILDGKELQG